MRVFVGEEIRTGRAIDLREFDLDVTTVADAIRSEATTDCPVTVDCPDPGPAHDHVGVVDVSATVSLRVALADAARSRGHTAPQADELAAITARLDELDPRDVDLQRARKRVADASDVEAELRERVATLRGRVRALRETDADAGTARPTDRTEAAAADLSDATRRLSEVQTERIAAEQALARAREQARDARETRRERLRLEDRAGNLRREARDTLSEYVSDDFENARDALPDGADLGESVETALAVARVADLDAPVVLARGVDVFESPEAATEWLGAPVVRV